MGEGPVSIEQRDAPSPPVSAGAGTGNRATLHMQTGQPLAWVIAILVLLAFPLSIAYRATIGKQSAPRAIIELPAWELTSDSGKPFGSAELRGRAYVANFFFTSCPSVCPRLMKKMAEIEERTAKHGGKLQLVSITVDPDNDSPEVLRGYAPKYRKDSSRWSLLTGNHEQLDRVITQGFKVATGTNPDTGIFHSEKVVLVDQRGRVRRYYDADEQGITELVRDSEAVLAE